MGDVVLACRQCGGYEYQPCRWVIPVMDNPHEVAKEINENLKEEQQECPFAAGGTRQFWEVEE